ncbi:AAA family ATPase [Ralstonia pseudosolanacearum]|uniref:AAA family ATPase n=1 Tax=Ralstonia pseudosolanacearum TaxID=1310165 RepID=UPI0026774B7A|nr:AAA family ATPase [Ralstonia pseudosolanacearum]MDO3535113.1 AAA family ATPase [Ralstonia pseudosolanacearum]
MNTTSLAAVEESKSAEEFHFRLTALRFSDGTTLQIGENDMVVIVGGNNAGKSRTLKDIHAHFTTDMHGGGNYQGLVVHSVESVHTTEISSVESWLQSEDAITDVPGASIQALGRGSRHPRSAILNWFKDSPAWRKKILGVHCIELLDTETRLSIANPAQAISFSRSDPTSNPIQRLYKDDGLEKEISDYFHEAFHMDVVVNRGDGGTIPLHCGERPIPSEGEDCVSKGYLERLIKLPLAHEQGDGMRSFLGCLLRVFVWKPFVTLLDEPEAFLHPPQARYLGSLLASKKPQGRQVVVATHSGDFLRGVLDANAQNVKIVRLNRTGNTNHPTELSSSDLRTLWTDPLLRHSNLLDGVFHDGVVLCEADTDCQFYSAVLEAVVRNQPRIRRPHLLFAHVGGKDRFRSIVPALRSLGVPIRVIADFDMLSAEHPLRVIVAGLGGDWEKIAKDFNILHAAMKGQRKELSKAEVQAEISTILASAGEVIAEADADKIRSVVKRGSPWALAKLAGKSFVPTGDATQAYQRLHTYLSKIGICIVEVGEMECFCKSIGGHGTKWVNEVMKRDLATDPELQHARDFVSSIWDSRNQVLSPASHQST